MAPEFGRFPTALKYVMIAISHTVFYVCWGHLWSALVFVGHAVTVDIRTFTHAM